jgi:hypothetical protein
MSFTLIEDYEPDDRAWGVVTGRFMQPPPPPAEDVDEQAVTPESDDE